ncbi:MAG TPA: hypothetical protein VK891_07140 [Euzebyales bacterium]|nr:hypothetical protein [Euzebyales bacterium]
MPPPQRLERRAPRSRWRDRFYTRQTAEAIMAPSSIVAAGAGTAAGVLLGLGPVAALVGVVAYGGWVLLKMPRARVPAEGSVDPRRLRDPWRTHVREALQAEQRFAEAVGSTSPGPLRERLDGMGDRVADAVSECWRIANRGQQLEDALGKLEPIGQLEAKLARASGNDNLSSAIRSQIDSYRRIEQTAVTTRERLQLLEARLDETVARAVEVGLRAGDPVEIGALDDDVESLVNEMEALRRGLEETAGQAMGA